MTMLDPHLDVDQLSAAVDGAQDAAVSAHLLTCMSCREQVRTWQRSLGQLKDLANPTAPHSTDEMVDVAMMAWRRPVRDRRRRYLGPIAAAVAAIVVIGGGIVGLSHLTLTGGSSSSASSGGQSGVAGRAPGAVSSGSGNSGSSGSAGSSGSSGVPSRGGTGTAAGKSTPSPRPLVADRATLRADLRRDVARGSVPARVPASTPCLGAARTIAATGSTSGAGGASSGSSALSSAGPKASFETSVDLNGVRGRVFLFRRRGGGYVALVLRDRSCSLVTSLTV